MADKVEMLADHVHEVWGRWIKYMFGFCTPNEDDSLTIPREKVERWTRQRATPYAELSADERESDRVIAREMLEIINQD